MKKQIKFFALTAIIASTLFTACKKNKDDEAAPVPTVDPVQQQIQSIIPQQYIDSLARLGFTFNNGNTPPSLNGIYRFDPVCDYDNSYMMYVGYRPTRANIKIENQSNTAATVYFRGLASLDGIDTSASQVITGTGNTFTMYSKFILTSRTPNPTIAYVITATKSANGLMNPKGAFVMVDDNGNTGVMPTGTIRIFHDDTSLCENINVFRMRNNSADVKSKELLTK